MRPTVRAVLVFLAVGCAVRDADVPDPVQAPRCPVWSPPSQAGRVQVDAIGESSGLVASRRHADTLWVHNDSGDEARLFAIGTAGDLRGVVSLTGVQAQDWEDLAAAPGPDGEPALYVADIGDNDEERDEVHVLRLAEPATLDGTVQAPTPAAAHVHRLTYPDGPHNAEALLVEPDGSLLIVTKAMEGDTFVYRAAAPVGPTTMMQPVARIDIGAAPMDGDKLVTAGDLSSDGSLVLLRTYLRTWVWTRAPGEAVADVFSRAPCPAPTPPERQGEAVGFAAEGGGYWSVSEGDEPVVWRIDVAR